ncbi:hypothetical protein LCGC14_0789720 [marine sediment metagenome]|uniref:Uncharacterized protein n=1 Tax=marine sediment metagenome TaxID=412755 RepID=A0A0F9SCY2_9ZZZZ
MVKAKTKAKGERQHNTLPGTKYPPLKVESPEAFDAAVDEYMLDAIGEKTPITISGALLWMGIYDQHTLAAYAERDGFGPSVKRLRAIVRHQYELRLYSNNPTGAIFALKNMGWSDKVGVELTGAEGGPVQTAMEVTFVAPKSQD